MVVHLTDDVLLVGPSQQEVAATVDMPERKNKAQKVQGNSTSVKFQWTSGEGTC